MCLHVFNISYKEAFVLYIKANMKAKNYHEVFQIIKTQLNKNKIQNVDKTCSICMEDIIDGDNNIIALSYGHSLHKSCFQKNYIIHMNNKCPMCRQPLTKEDGEVLLKRTSKPKYWKHIKQEIDTADDYEHEVTKRYRFYKNVGLMFEQITVLYNMINMKANQMNKPLTMYPLRMEDVFMGYYFTQFI